MEVKREFAIWLVEALLKGITEGFCTLALSGGSKIKRRCSLLGGMIMCVRD